MRKSANILFSVLAVLLASGTEMRAQEVKMPLSERLDESDFALRSNYDRFEDITTVTTGFIPGPDVYLTLYYTCEGQNFCIPNEKENVLLGFYQRGETWKYLENSKLIFLLDGEERLNLGQIAHEGKIQTGGEVVELMAVPVTLETLKQILSADTVEYRLGTTTTKLGTRQRDLLTAAMKEMYPEWDPDGS